MNIVLQYSRSKMKSYLRPLERLFMLYKKKDLAITRYKLFHWNHLIYSEQKGTLSQVSNVSSPNPNQKIKSNQSHTSFKIVNYNPSSYQFEWDQSQNTSKNAIIRLMKANRLNNMGYNCLTQSQMNESQFLQRQNSFLLNKEKSKQRLQKETEKESKYECTFAPKINTTHYNKKLKRNKSAFLRLYDEGVERKNRKDTKESEHIALMKMEATPSTKTHYDPKKIDELYEDYKKKEQKQKELSRRINGERDLPFTPNANLRKKHKKNNISFDEMFNQRIQDKENLEYVLDHIKSKEVKEKY